MWEICQLILNFCISSSSAVKVMSLIRYVKNQAEHHKTISFKNELIRLLNEHEVQFKDEYLFI